MQSTFKFFEALELSKSVKNWKIKVKDGKITRHKISAIIIISAVAPCHKKGFNFQPFAPCSFY